MSNVVGTVGFDETFMSAGAPLERSSFPGFGDGNRIPSTSRVERKSAKAATRTGMVKKGLARSCVVVSWSGRTATVRLKGSEAIVGVLRNARGGRGNSFSYKLVSEDRSHSGFPTEKAAVLRMLEKV